MFPGTFFVVNSGTRLFQLKQYIY